MILALLPADQRKLKGGRPPADRRRVMDAIFYRLRTGCQWKAIPRSLAASSTAHDYFQRWAAAGVFFRLWHVALKQYDQRVGLTWTWQALKATKSQTHNRCRVIAPAGGSSNAPIPG